MLATTDIDWRMVDGVLKPVYRPDESRDVIWAPQPGSQEAFLSCPFQEVLYEGTRGPGKTDALLMSFLQYVGIGLGQDWRGILFRRAFPELKDVITKSKKWFPQIFPRAKFNEGKNVWTFPDGEQLIFSFMRDPDDYYKYHGHQYPWVGFEELTNWPTDECMKRMFSCMRSSNPKVPIMMRATCNPYGVGHNWVKARYNLPVQRGFIGLPVREEGEPARIAIHGSIYENRILLSADPSYIDRLRASARNAAELAAWLEGSWDIISGGMLDDIWDRRIHVLPTLHPTLFPRGWRLDRAYDHGQSRPFSVGWYAQSDGQPLRIPLTESELVVGPVKGDLIRFAEWYGWTKEPNKGLRMTAREIAEGIVQRELQMCIRGRVRRGIADAAIFDEWEPGKSVAGDMKKAGVTWNPADKSKGSRTQGWEQLRSLLKQALPPKEGGQREEPGFFVTENCTQFLRTMPVLPRDEDNPDDVDSDAEDHIADEVRYRCRAKLAKKMRVVKG